MEVGNVEGSSVGKPVGFADGSEVGDVEGSSVGKLVGFADGLAVGEFDGLKVGILVGIRVGFIVGLLVGIDVVGDSVKSQCCPFLATYAVAANISLNDSQSAMDALTMRLSVTTSGKKNGVCCGNKLSENESKT